MKKYDGLKYQNMIANICWSFDIKLNICAAQNDSPR